MIFSSYFFIFIFLPLVFIGYFLFNRTGYNHLTKLWLVIASFVFYGYGSPAFFPFFLASVTGNYLVGGILTNLRGDAGEEKNGQRKLTLAIGIAANVILLGYYKYTDFIIANINAAAHTDITLRHIILPIGISFFTFQLIAFLVDSYRGIARAYSFLDYLLFITFFPQLIVGPIVHHGEMIPQFEDKAASRLNWDNRPVLKP
jgi:D-alanyl-lipoteichoic acid acyltransferase DltB (MBOAT superfamily)